MLKRFRRRFMLITMALVAVVSLAAFVAVGVMTNDNLRSNIDQSLERALNQHSFTNTLPFLGIGQDNPGENNNSGGDNNMGNSIPAYTVTVDWVGNIVAENNATAQMSEDVLNAAVSEVINSGTSEGRISDYNLYYETETNALGRRIAFVDSSSYEEAVGRMISSFVSGWLLLMIAVFLITLFLSRYVTKPVEAAWKTQQQFIADASHELKTPLTVILADASILAKNPEKSIAEQQMWVDGISSEAERMRRLTEDMLTLARADAGENVAPTLAKLDLSQMAEKAVLQFEAAAFERGLLIEEDIEENLMVMGAPDKLDGLLKTLLENACKYGSGSGQSIGFSLKREHNNAVLAVSNGGQDIPPEDLPHIFDRFYRSDKSRVQEGESASFGLGLSIAKSTAELHKGSIAVSSGGGTTVFTVLIPLAK